MLKQILDGFRVCMRLTVIVGVVCKAQAFTPSTTDADSLLDACNVSWNVPGPTSSQSMPIGNGDIGLNVWVETNGDLNFYIGKTDAWSENNVGSYGLLKLGAVRVSLNPRPAVDPFLQVLKLRTGEIVVQESGTTLKVWVDANNPVIRVEFISPKPVSIAVALNDWRTNKVNGISADTIISNQKNVIVWYHRNPANIDSNLANNTFGAIIKGSGFTNAGDTTLQSSAPAKNQAISIFPLTAKTATADEWLAQLQKNVAGIDALNFEKMRKAHYDWWNQFWQRSWIFVGGDAAATNNTEGYVLQRFITACAGRGAYPIKFNGSIFNVDDPSFKMGSNSTNAVNADYRRWGGQYWFQNTRPMYWPRLQAGDFDMMLPLFNMYANSVPTNGALISKYYGHAGAYFAETAPFYGGLKYAGPDAPENFTLHYFTPILELSMMMLDYYDYTGDKTFAAKTLLPVAHAGLTFFDKHFKRDAEGKLLLDPDNAIEMYWKVQNPAPDIAGLRAIIPRLIALPDSVVSPEQKKDWERLLKEIPPLPIGMRNGKQSLLPYTGEQTAKPRNGENPELYAVYPFRLYGIGSPDLQLAIDSFNTRRCTQKGCWVQDPIQAAMLGLSDVAKEYVTFNLNRTQPGLKFPAFWAQSNDYAPDEDNGGNGENGLQQMILQANGKKIFLLPAWPREWNVSFKLHAPFQTTVQGIYQNGRLADLIVIPPERKADIVDTSSR